MRYTTGQRPERQHRAGTNAATHENNSDTDVDETHRHTRPVGVVSDEVVVELVVAPRVVAVIPTVGHHRALVRVVERADGRFIPVERVARDPGGGDGLGNDRAEGSTFGVAGRTTGIRQRGRTPDRT